MAWYCHLRCIADPLNENGDTPHTIRFKEPFRGYKVSFGVLAEYPPIARRGVK